MQISSPPRTTPNPITQGQLSSHNPNVQANQGGGADQAISISGSESASLGNVFKSIGDALQQRSESANSDTVNSQQAVMEKILSMLKGIVSMLNGGEKKVAEGGPQSPSEPAKFGNDSVEGVGGPSQSSDGPARNSGGSPQSASGSQPSRMDDLKETLAKIFGGGQKGEEMANMFEQLMKMLGIDKVDSAEDIAPSGGASSSKPSAVSEVVDQTNPSVAGQSKDGVSNGNVSMPQQILAALGAVITAISGALNVKSNRA